MAEYIEREAAIKLCTFGRTSLGLVDELRRLPAADVRPVVRCKECKNYMERSGACAYLVVGMREDDFCSYGKKREES